MVDTSAKIGNRIAPPRFILFMGVFALITAVGIVRMSWSLGLMIGFDAAALTFLIAIASLLRATSQDDMRRHAAENDANRVVLLVIAAVLTVAVLAAVYAELKTKGGPNVPLVIATLALAWLFGNTIYALHYAHVYYLEGSEGGLDFSGEPDAPDYWDFIYFAYTLGMTFQTSDTGITTRALRKLVTAHSLVAFVFNIGIIAFSINTLGGK